MKSSLYIKSHFLVFLLIGLLCACETDINRVRQITSKKDVFVETGKDVEILYSANGKVIYKIIGAKLIRHNLANPYTEFPDGVELFVYDDSMEVESKLTANYGVNYELQRRMIVRDNVVLVNNKGEKLATEELIWDESKGKVYSDVYVEITTPDEIIYGDGFEADEDFSNYKIKKIRGTIDVKSEENI